MIPSRSWRLSIPRTLPLFPVQVVDDSSTVNSSQSAFISPQVTVTLNFVHSSTDYRCAQPDLTPLQSRDVHFNPLSRQTGSFRRIPRRSSLLSVPQTASLPASQQSHHTIAQPTARSAVFSSVSKQIVDPLRVVQPRVPLRSPVSRFPFMHSCIASTQIA